MQYWNQYYDEETPALVYVIDSSNEKNFLKSKQALHTTVKVIKN